MSFKFVHFPQSLGCRAIRTLTRTVPDVDVVINLLLDLELESSVLPQLLKAEGEEFENGVGVG